MRAKALAVYAVAAVLAAAAYALEVGGLDHALEELDPRSILGRLMWSDFFGPGRLPAQIAVSHVAFAFARLVPLLTAVAGAFVIARAVRPVPQRMLTVRLFAFVLLTVATGLVVVCALTEYRSRSDVLPAGHNHLLLARIAVMVMTSGAAILGLHAAARERSRIQPGLWLACGLAAAGSLSVFATLLRIHASGSLYFVGMLVAALVAALVLPRAVAGGAAASDNVASDASAGAAALAVALLLGATIVALSASNLEISVRGADATCHGSTTDRLDFVRLVAHVASEARPWGIGLLVPILPISIVAFYKASYGRARTLFHDTGALLAVTCAFTAWLSIACELRAHAIMAKRIAIASVPCPDG